ncbi:hypothetical protein [Chengkuizengella axinellae]|uniref:Sporulation membrane protein YtrI C-terminal domain-containing protein n=1 Tax=Chengkuizengella axinellae TaxID=3064388 RepID=A0ABT9IYG4_9BACL|nr:hypothetical protein [Chengkuizengella sp. 2205SS18-9]MDP5274406.1 hypothetical protein [Chengkuizengella sp. 2205SS18-9]
MRVPSISRFLKYLQAIALIISGMIIGAAIYMIIYQHNMQVLFKMNETIRQENKDLLSKIEGLEKYKDSNTVINSIVINIQEKEDKEPLDDLIKNDIKDLVREDLKVLKGKQVSLIYKDPDYIRQLYGRKNYPNVHEKAYVVEIQNMFIVYGEATFWIHVEEFNPEA